MARWHYPYVSLHSGAPKDSGEGTRIVMHFVYGDQQARVKMGMDACFGSGKQTAIIQSPEGNKKGMFWKEKV